MVKQYELLVNGREIPFSTAEQLKACLRALHGEEFIELCLKRGAGPSLTALVHRDRGWLMFLRHPGDAGFSSRDRPEAAADPADPGDLLEFRLSNGQYDEYPAHWCLPLSEVWEAVLYFFEHGDKAPGVLWHDDSGD